ncbi:LysR family transcriptional regulator, D-serine deaminase activator [Collimonas sp. OK607]|uniref:DNA-binding transcriptional regulator DsdC n=1 Tax=Collimonas sp. OK607 TaxID=1798194 RepID=UPI0008F04CAA|nr:DNA-binding transcriptional regulator DsdC [Collimonas sp. OK607]SFB41547.1 LysR family transcriptional regulator, D-serine deaminase activator [Collimonas sp. OK607]
MLNLPPRIGSRLNSTQFSNLYTFLVAARHLSFSRAADELCLTPSAVSHRIGRLESALSIRLFQRLTRQVCLTEEGERIFRILQDAVGELSEALQQTSQAEVAGAIALYVRPSVAQCWLVPRLGDFAERYPLVSLDIRVGNDNADFRTRNIDLALYYANGDFPGLVSHKLMGEKMAPVCSPEYARRHGLLDNPDNLRQCTLLHDSLAWDNAAYDAEWTLWATQQGMAALLPERGITFDRSDLCVIAAMNHAGVAIGRQQLVQKRIDQGELILPFGSFTQSGHYDYYLVHPPHDPMPRRLQVFIDWLHECASQSLLINGAEPLSG